MAQARYYSSIAATTTLSVSIDDVTTTLTPATTSGFPASYPYLLILEKDTANEELVDVTGSTGTALTVVRGVDGTAARGHSAGTSVEHGVSARDFRESRQHEAASEQVHGIEAGSNVVGETDTQTLTNKTIDGATIINPNFEISAPDGETPALNVPGDLNMQNYKIINLGDPVNEQDGVNRRYLESRIPELTGDDVELAKQWAIKMDGKVQDEDYSSKYYANDASGSATAALESANNAKDSEIEAANSAIEASQYAANALAIWEDFDKRYLGAHEIPPITDNFGEELQQGALYYNTWDKNMYVWDGDQWIVASSAAIDTFDQYEWTATDGQTVFTTNKDMNPTMIQVYVNGVMVAKSDYTADKRSVTLLEPTIAGDLVQVHAFQEATILSSVITSQDVDYVVVLPFDSWPLPDPDIRTLYVVLPEEGKDYGTLWLGSIQIGGGGANVGAPPPPLNIRWNSDDPAVTDYRMLEWDESEEGELGPATGYAVVPANAAAENVTITHANLTDRSARITDTDHGVEYCFSVVAANLAGAGEKSPPICRMFPGPDAPTNLRSLDDDAFTLTWEHDHSGGINGDRDTDIVEVEQNVLTRLTPPVVDVIGNTAKLDPDDFTGPPQKYKFRVRAGSPDEGFGEWSEEYIREFVLPDAPYNLRVEGASLLFEYDQVDTGEPIGWSFQQQHDALSDPPEETGLPPADVTDLTFGTVTEIETVDGTTTYSVLLSDSTPFANYRVAVKTANQHGESPWSMESMDFQINFDMPTLLHTGTKMFQVPEWVDFMVYEVVKKSDNSRVQLITTDQPVQVTAQGDFMLRFGGSESGPWITTQDFGSKNWAYENYQYGNCCNANNPCPCASHCNQPGPTCYNCCGETCGPCTGQRPINYPAPWQYGPGSNTYPYSGSGHWWYIKERNDNP